jgi:hypothetical protein
MAAIHTMDCVNLILVHYTRITLIIMIIDNLLVWTDATHGRSFLSIQGFQSKRQQINKQILKLLYDRTHHFPLTIARSYVHIRKNGDYMPSMGETVRTNLQVSTRSRTTRLAIYGNYSAHA